MTICVFGGLGHIGSKFLEHAGSGVIVVDNLASSRYCSLFGKSLTFIEGDILTYPLYKIVKRGDIIVHLAALTDAATSSMRAAEVHEVNMRGALRVAKVCADAGAKMIFPSTTSVYGKQDGIVDEDCDELAPQSAYAQSKLDIERALGLTGARYVVLRLGTIYGPSIGMRWHTAVQKFLWCAITNQPVTVWSTAMVQKRPYCYLGDAIEAFMHVIKNDMFDGRTYNVLTGNHTVRDVLDTISKYRKLKVEMTSNAIMNQLSYQVSCERFKRTGWEPHGNLTLGILETLQLFEGVNRG